MTLSANLSSWENILFFKTFTKPTLKSDFPVVFQSFNDPLYIVFKNETHTSLQSINITPQVLCSYGYSLTLALDDIQRARSSILKLVTYHMRLKNRKNTTKNVYTKEKNTLFVLNEKNSMEKSLNLVEASESILRLLIGLCLYKKINYVQGFLHILLNLCYLNPCPLYNVDSAFHLFHQFLLLACPHLLQSETNRKICCKSQQTLCLLFHQLLQYHFPSVAYHIDRFHDTVFWNLHWFDCLGTTCFSNPLVWLDVWYYLTYFFFYRLEKATLPKLHHLQMNLWTNNFCPVAMYCEWIFFTLAVIRYFYTKGEKESSSDFQLGERVAQKLCSFHEADIAETWDDVWLSSEKKFITFYDFECKDSLKSILILRNPVNSTKEVQIPSHLQSMLYLRLCTPPFWLCRLTGYIPKNYSNLCQSSFISLFDYSSFYCLPAFWKELVFWSKIFEEKEICSNNEVCGQRLRTSDSKSTECSSFSSEPLSRTQLLTKPSSRQTHSYENTVHSFSEQTINHETMFEKDIHKELEPKDILSLESWSSSFTMSHIQHNEKMSFLKVILIPFDTSVSSCYPINTPIGRDKDVIHSSFNVPYITILTPSRPESKGFCGFQRLCTIVNQDSTVNTHLPPCWLSYSLDTTIALIRHWTQFKLVSTPLFVIGNPISSTNFNQCISSSVIQDGVIQVVKKMNARSIDTGWLSYNKEPQPCQISFFLRCMEAGIKYITLCPDFSSNSDHVMLLIRRILTHLSTYKCIQTPSSLFRRRIVKKPLTVSKTNNRSKNCSSTKSWPPIKASDMSYDSQSKKKNNDVILEETKSIQSSPPFQQLLFVRRVKINKKKICKSKELDPLMNDSSPVHNTSIFSWFQSFFQKKQEMTTRNILLSPLEENQKITKKCTSFYQYHDLPDSVNRYRRMIKTPLQSNKCLTTRFSNEKKHLKKKKHFASWWKMRKIYILNHENLHLLLSYSKYKQFLFHETLKWKTKYTFAHYNVNNLHLMSCTKALIKKPMKCLQSKNCLPAPSKIVLWKKNWGTNITANLHTVQKRLQKTVDFSLLETPVKTFSPLLTFFREHFFSCHDKLICRSSSKLCSNGNQLKKRLHSLDYTKNWFFYHHECSVLILNATCHFIYETRLFCQILYFLFQVLSHTRQTSKKIMLHVTKKDLYKLLQHLPFLMIKNCPHMSNKHYLPAVHNTNWT